MGDWIWRDDHWVHNPQIPTPVTAADYDPSATRVDIPAVGGRVTYDGHVDYPRVPSEETWAADSWGEDGHLVTATDNSLRPADLALPQPSQDPEWRP
ncbi:MAG: hypothetical protein L0I24_12335 [Pseudonocardia sp.]|nr:hypothetical protein [Pseudonocardia sp.]